MELSDKLSSADSDKITDSVDISSTGDLAVHAARKSMVKTSGKILRLILFFSSSIRLMTHHYFTTIIDIILLLL